MKKIFCTIILLIVVLSTFAQHEGGIGNEEKNVFMQKQWRVRVSAGYSIGGTAPLPLPREIRGINGYSPGFGYRLGVAVQKLFNGSRWGVETGLYLENKGMTTYADTKNYHMEAWNSDGKVVGAFTGKVKTKVDNKYLTLPLLCTYDASVRWSFSAGAYFSYLLDGEFAGRAYDGYIRDQNPTGEKADVTRAYYSFGDDLRKFHWGLQAGCEYRFYNKVAASASLQWGMNSIFHSGFGSVTFDLYPIYATLGLTYLL